MAITNVLAYSGNGPTATGQVLANRAEQGNSARTLIGTVTFTLDGAATTSVINYIDGTATLPYNPSALFWSRIGGSEGTAVVNKIVDNANGIGATATLSAVGTNTNTLIYSLMICK